MVTYRCDGPRCTSIVMAEHRFEAGPDDWYSLTPAGTEEFDFDGELHFCTRNCLFNWVVEQGA